MKDCLALFSTVALLLSRSATSSKPNQIEVEIRGLQEEARFCAFEGGVCSFDGTKTVRYGAGERFFAGSFTDQVECSNDVFGDPIFGRFKTCAVVSGEPFSFCAEEGEVCSFEGTRTVRYGAEGKFFTDTFTDEVSCNNDVFGDPIRGTRKFCELLLEPPSTPTPTPSFNFCALEGSLCVFEGTKTVRYGANGNFFSGVFSGQVECTNAVFGDPIEGTAKTCQVEEDAFTFCATEGGTCNFQGTKVVRYGANGQFATGTFTDKVNCVNAIFGDPIPGTAKTCEVQGGIPPILNRGDRNANTFSSFDAGADGEFSGAYALGVIPIHAMVLPDGKVSSFGATERTPDGRFVFSVFDPKTGFEEVLPNTLQVNIFCSFLALDADTGDIIIVGGDDQFEAGTAGEEKGRTGVVLFDYKTRTLKQAPQGELKYGRYYPTLVTLPNGEVLVLAGRDIDFLGATIPEVVVSDQAYRELVDAPVPDFIDDDFWYPHAFVNSLGDVIVVEAVDEDIYRLNASGSGTIQKIGQINFESFKLAPSLLVRTDKAAILGSDGGIYVADISSPTAVPSFEKVADIGLGRISSAMVPLPDGKVAFVGGELAENEIGNFIEDAIRFVQIWDPDTNVVQTLDESSNIARLYHSSGILLPDATIWTGGGGAPGPLANSNVEFYAPAYLYDGSGALVTDDRPVISSAPKNIGIGETFNVKLSNVAAQDIAKVTLIKSGSFTHARNTDARFLSTSFSVVDSETISVTTPTNANVFIRGLWFLYVIDDKGVPSEASILGVDMIDIVDTPAITQEQNSLQVYNIDFQRIRGPFQISVEARFDDLSRVRQKVFDFSGGELDSSSRILLGQFEDSRTDMEFVLVQFSGTFRVVARNALVEGELATWTVGIDSNGSLTIAKNGVLLGQEEDGEVPVDIERKLSFVGQSNEIDDDRLVGLVRNLEVVNLL